MKAGFCSASFTRPKRDPFRQHRGLLVQLQLGLAAQQCRKSTDAKWHLYYWYGIPGALGEAFTAAWAGASDGVGFNVPMLVDCSSYNKYKDTSAYWVGDVVGVLTAAATFTLAADIRIPTAWASRSKVATVVANSAARFVASGNGKVIDTQSPKLAQQIAKVVASLRITGTPPAGVYQGGYKGETGVYANLTEKLPERPLGYYTESAVWLGKAGTERIVIGQQLDEVWYSPDHYGTFRRWQ